VTASGGKNLRNLTITLAKDRKESQPHTVRLYFAEPESIKSGQRVFDVAIQGEPVLKAFDVVREAGAPYRGIVKEFKGIKISENLIVKLTPSRASGSAGPILCGLEVIAEGLVD